MERWSGKVAVVTGASSGIGRSVAVELVKHGMKVVALARRVEKLNTLSDELAGCSTGFMRTFKCDVRNRDDIKAAFEFTLENLGPVSVLINNAGTNKITSLTESDVNAALQVIETNVMGVINCTMEATSMMKKHEIDGHIVNIGSVTGNHIVPKRGLGIYTASKHAVTALSECLRNDIGFENSNIKVTNISPGLVETEMTAQIMEHKPNLRLVHDKDVTDCILFALQAPKHVNISEITVQGVGEIFTKW